MLSVLSGGYAVPAQMGAEKILVNCDGKNDDDSSSIVGGWYFKGKELF